MAVVRGGGGAAGVLDASVLVQEPTRTLVLWIATHGGFEPRWSERILEETRRALLRIDAVTAAQWQRLSTAMVGAFPDAAIDQAAIDAIEDQMTNDPKDRHVLAAAVVARAGMVITNNLADFRPADVQAVGQRAVSVDAFLCEMLNRAPVLVRTALDDQVAHMHQGPRAWTIEQLLGRLAGLGHGDPLAGAFARRAATSYGLTLRTPPARGRPVRPQTG